MPGVDTSSTSRVEAVLYAQPPTTVPKPVGLPLNPAGPLPQSILAIRTCNLKVIHDWQTP